MKEKKIISIRKLAALERAKALGLAVRRPAISALERRAQEWKRLEGMGKCEVGDPKSSEDDGSELPAFHEVAAEAIPWTPGSIGEDVASETTEKSETDEGFNWQPYDSGQGKVERKPKKMNSASIAAMARKIMAREWAMALGRSRSLGSEQSTIERGAEQFRQKKEAESKRKEVGEKRACRQRVALEAALRNFGRNLVEASKPVTPETAETLLEAALTDVGEFISITWQEEDGCRILIEPWEERRLRRKNREMAPAVFQARIDENLMLSSFEKIQDPQLLRQTQNDLILKNILSSFGKSPQKDLYAFKNAVSERGRIIWSTKMDGGLKINFEPWEEMRKRNLGRKGRSPVIIYVIKTDKDFEHITCARGQ